MSIREDSKRIIEDLTEKAIRHGDLKHEIPIQDSGLASALNLSDGYFHVCIQYLKEKGFIQSHKTKEDHFLTLTAYAIDFLEDC